MKTRCCSRVSEVGGDQGAARRTEVVDAVGPVVADVDPPVRVGDLVHDYHGGHPMSSGLESGASGLHWVRNPRTGQEPCSDQAKRSWAVPGLNLRRTWNAARVGRQVWPREDFLYSFQKLVETTKSKK